MNILIPMAGAGQRFVTAGYTKHKPAIPTINRRTGKTSPMVVCAALDLPGLDETGKNLILIDRTFHKRDGLEAQIKEYLPKTTFVTVDDLTQGQASTCLVAKYMVNNDSPLLIAGCDNGMLFEKELFEEMTELCDVIVFTYRNNESVLENPNAYGWVVADAENNITDISIKKALSSEPTNDHAIVATFWFKHGNIFVEAAEKMICENDRVNGEFYVDEVIRHVLELGYNAKAFEIQRYIGWGTPKDYEDYMNTWQYWTSFVQSDSFLPGVKP